MKKNKEILQRGAVLKRRLLCLLLLLFALFAVIIVVPRALDGTLSTKTEPAGPEPGIPPMETMEKIEFPYETVAKEEESTTPAETEPQAQDDPGEPVDREKVETELIFASDIHYISPNLTDYGNAFHELVDNGDGKVVRYMVEIWDAFAEEVIAAHPDALILSGDLTINGERLNHQEFAFRLAKIEAAGIPVLVIPGNHDINNPYATQYVGNAQSFVETVSPEGFRTIYADYGYYEAASHAPDSLSYLYVLNETTWMLMIDSCIYAPENEVDGEIKEGTMLWIEQCFKEAYAQGITVIPVAHHNLQELSRVYVEECVIRNHDELLVLLEKYLTPAFFSGHLHVQRIMKHMKGPGTPSEVYGITEMVSNALIIPPCQYGRLSLHEDGTMSYHTKNTDVSDWAAKHGIQKEDLLNFPQFSDQYIRNVVKNQIYKYIKYIPDDRKERMAEYYANLYKDYYAGRLINYEERTEELGYIWWDNYMNPSVPFRQIEGMLKDSVVNNNNVEIPNPIRQIRE